MVRINKKTKTLLQKIYGVYGANVILKEISKLPLNNEPVAQKFGIKCALITYADTIVSNKKRPLNALDSFLSLHDIRRDINTVHILPFYPWDTDRGFSVKNYYQVNSEYGNWNDIGQLGKKNNLMFDFVANHASIDNPIIQGALIERHLVKSDFRYKKFKKFKDFAICYDSNNKPSQELLEKLSRPRPTPVLSPYYVVDGFAPRAILGIPQKNTENILGRGWVWTTFSRPLNNDGSEATKQVDLNFKNPKVFVETIKILCFYANKGATLIRLDAIGYIWKKLGRPSLHEKEAHTILKAIYSIMKIIKPNLISVSEVNEPQERVFEYLGTKTNPESDFVYQFAHFPLAIFSLMESSVEEYSKWYKSTEIFNGKQFVTVLGSHDGLGLKPVRNILPEPAIQRLISYLVNKHNALANFALLPGGKKITYELCSTPWNLITNHRLSEEIGIKRVMVVVALGLLVKGIPAYYINGLIAASNYKPKGGLDENRTVNREIFTFGRLQKMLYDPNTKYSKVMGGILKLSAIRNSNTEFNMESPFPVTLNVKNAAVFGLILKNNHHGKLISLINVSQSKQIIQVPKKLAGSYMDLVGNSQFDLKTQTALLPYQILWLK